MTPHHLNDDQIAAHLHGEMAPSTMRDMPTVDDAWVHAWQATAPAPVETDSAAFLADLRQKIETESIAVPVPVPVPVLVPSQAKRAPRARLGLVTGICAGVLAVTAVGLYAWRSGTQPSGAGDVRAYHTSVGERATVALRDGSRITLAPLTKVQVTDGADGRTVVLHGEAHFEVVASQRTPFRVQTGGVSTTVLGTSFNIEYYDPASPVRISVIDGKVSAQGIRSERALTLAAGMSALVTDSSAAMMQGVLDQSSGWRTGQLVFDDVPASSVLATLERWYGYRFEVSDSVLVNQHVTATFNVMERTKTMSALQDLLDVSMTVRDSVVMLSPRRAVPSIPKRNSQFFPRMEAGK